MIGLAIELSCADGRVASVAIGGSRPEPARVLVGRTPGEALVLLRRLYAVCGHAQEAAGALALAAAGAVPDAGAPADSRQRLRAEAAREHLWRLLIDWPACVGRPPDGARFANWQRRCGGAAAAWAPLLAAELSRLLGAADGAALAAGDDAGLGRHDRWLDAHATPLATLLAAVRALGSRRAETADDETGPYPRLADHPWLAALAAAGRGLEARVIARALALAELVADTVETDLDGAPLEEGAGRAAVCTARGVLVHEARVAGGRIVGYAIRTPTDLNFAPRGPYARRVVGLACEDDASAVRLARAWALALDPCVPCSVRVAGAAGAAGTAVGAAPTVGEVAGPLPERVDA